MKALTWILNIIATIGSRILWGWAYDNGHVKVFIIGMALWFFMYAVMYIELESRNAES